MELAWDEPTLARFLGRLASLGRLITFDKRGTGLSDRVPEDQLPTHEERMERLHDFFRLIISDFDMHKGQLKAVEAYAIALGFSPANAKKVVQKSIKIFSGQIDLEDYMYLMEK